MQIESNLLLPACSCSVFWRYMGALVLYYPQCGQMNLH